MFIPPAHGHSASGKAGAASPLELILRQTRPVLLWVGMFSFVINLCILPISLYSLQVLDRVLSTHSTSTLIWLSLFMVVILLVAAALMALRSIVLIRMANWVVNKLHRLLLPLSLDRASQPNRQADSQPLKDTEAMRQFLSGSALTTLLDAPWAILYLLVLYIIHASIGVVVTIGAVILLMLAIFNDISQRKPSAEISKRHLYAMAGLDAALRNADAVSAMGMQGKIIERWHKARSLADASQTQNWNNAVMVESLSRYVRLLLQISVTGWSAWLALQGHITPGAIIAASILASRALAPFESAIGAGRAMQEARNAYRRIEQALEGYAPRTEGLSLPEVVGQLDVEKVIFGLPGSNKALIKGISLRLAAGSGLAIIGPSAAGKSTLARLIAGVWRPNSGAVRLDGADVYQWPRETFGPLIGYLPQDVEMFEGTVAQNIARLQENASEEAIIMAAQMAGAHEMILQLPNGYATEMGVGGIALSPGQRQRIGLARAFFGPPKLLVLDEPDASLDEFGRAALEGALKQAREMQITTVLITHHRSLLRYIDNLMVLRDGLIEKFGPTQEVLSEIMKASQAKLASNQPAHPRPNQPGEM